MTKKISVVVPVYFNSGSLEALFEKLENIAQKLSQDSLDFEVVAVDDGSQDNSLEIL